MGDVDLRFYLSLLLRRLPQVAAIIAVFTVGGVALALLMPALYRASAKILVEAPQIPTEMARSTVPISAVEQFEVIQQEVTTQDKLQALAKRLDVYGSDIAKMSATDVAEDMRERLHFEQVQLETQSRGAGATVFAISFDAKDPQLAARVVNDLVDRVVDKNAISRTGRAGETMKFFDQEVDRLGNELSGLEAEILKFKNANKDALPDSLDFRRSQQSGLQDRLSQMEREEAGLRSRRNNLVQLFQNTGQLATAGPLSPDQQMLQDMNRALGDQLTIFSETSPNVVALRKRIAALQEKITTASRGTDKKAGPTELDLQLSDIDERLRYISEEKASITDNIAKLTKSITATPGNDTRLSALERTRNNIQAQYNAATALQAQASTGEQIEAHSKGGRFSIVEPAVAPETPVRPNRLRIVATSILGGVAAGLGLVVLLELLNKTIRRPAELAEFLQAQPLATIPYIMSPEEKKSKFRRLRLGLALTGSIAVAAFLGMGASDIITPEPQNPAIGVSADGAV
ncbi:GumC family protein [Mesorhizobium sp. Root157]|uniref:GumC family protein n=1 Tax=Mesorhizobium sp. Root157 TaxID=1736477 RepID=UPI0009EB5B7A|nr:GNVR domain-containing protein [Mesorhizobium sp. Root157]